MPDDTPRKPGRPRNPDGLDAAGLERASRARRGMTTVQLPGPVIEQIDALCGPGERRPAVIARLAAAAWDQR